MYIYESCMGSLYTSDHELSYEERHCEQCGGSDWCIGSATTGEEAWNLFKYDTDINGSGGWDYNYIREFILNNYGSDINNYPIDFDPDCEDETMKFIWGVKSWDDLTGADACLYTMNDIDITYDKEKKIYMLGVETAYLFKTYGDECQYLRDCLKAFTKYMDENGLNKNEPYRLWMNNPCTSMEAETIEELYTNFKIFVDGFCNLDIDAGTQRH